MKIKLFLVILSLALLLGLTGCPGSGNTNTNTNANAPTPVAKTNESATVDPNLVSKVQEALKKKGFSDVTVDTAGGKMVLRGSYPKGKLAEVIAAAQEENGGKPVENQMTEKK